MSIEFERQPAGVRVRLPDHRIELSWYGRNILRVQARQAEAPSRPSLCVVGAPLPPAEWDVRGEGDGVLLRGPALTARIAADGAISFRTDGRELLREQPGGRAFPANKLPRPEDRHGAEQRFSLEPGDALYGLGQFPDGVMNWRGRSATLIHGNVTIVAPFLLSTGGWGLLWDNPSHTEFEDGPDGMRLWSEVADGLDYYICAGRNADAVISGYRRLTGAAPLFPRPFYGFIQCKERYKTAEELLEVVRQYRRRGLPLDVIVQDWQYWGPGTERWSGMRHDPQVYGDLADAVRAIHEAHARVMISIWPRIGVETELGRELAAAGHLFTGRPADRDKVYDAFSEEARAIYWRHVKEGLFDLGLDAWWMDGTEPEFEDCHDQQRHKASLLAQRDTAAGSWARVLNAFSLATTRGVYENQRRDSDEKRVFILSRSAWAGQQRYAAASWSGDIGASWATFRKQIPAGLNFSMAGLPYWTTDNGGFFVRGRGGVFPRGKDDPAFRELFLRWFQFSCFCPLMRSHGTQTPREIWQFGEPGETVYDALADFDRLRMRLLPYSYALAAMTTFEGYTPMRALAMDFGDDPATHGIADQFCYGPSLMACPVVRPTEHAPREAIRPFDHVDVVMPDGKLGGLRRRIFDGLDATEPAWEDKQKNVDYSWSGNRPRGASSNAYRVELTGALVVPNEDAPSLRLIVGGRIRVEIDGETALDAWTDAPTREQRIDMSAHRGRTVPVHIVYGHLEGDAVLLAGWQSRPEAVDSTATGVPEREVYLPAGSWYDFWTGRSVAGGGTVTLPAPLERIPVLVPAGSILPLGPHKQWQDERPEEPLEVRVYPGADGSFTLYEDAGDGYAYERGECSRIALTWHDATRVLSLGQRLGSFPGMLTERTLHVTLVSEGRGAGIDPTAEPDRTLPFDGRNREVSLA